MHIIHLKRDGKTKENFNNMKKIFRIKINYTIIKNEKESTENLLSVNSFMTEVAII